MSWIDFIEHSVDNLLLINSQYSLGMEIKRVVINELLLDIYISA